MPRNLITLTVLVATLAACTPVQDEVDVQQALQLAEQVRQGLEGNLCRCTGYQNIVKSVLAAAEAMGG